MASLKLTRGGTRKRLKKGVKGATAAKAARSALSRSGDRTGAFLGIGLVSGTGLIVLLRRRRKAAAPQAAGVSGDLNDPALARKVESEIFRPSDAPKGDVSVNVEHGVVYLRGTVQEASVGEALAYTARQIEGVKDVQNLLHTPGTPAPQKTESHDTVERPIES